MISVIIPLYNKEPIIEKCLQSVLSQEYDNFEVIVVNDGSTDRSAEIVRAIHDPRLRIIEQENKGPSAARNTGTCHSNGAWIVFLDADDEFLPGVLKRFEVIQSTHPDADIIDCGSILNNRKEKLFRSHKKEGLIKNNFKSWFYGELMPGTGHSMFRKSILLSNPYNEKIRRYEDAELLFRILPEAKIYKSKDNAFQVNCEFAGASKPRTDIKEDFMGHLTFEGKSFWQKMCIYKLFLEERDNYPCQMLGLYLNWYRRYDLLLLYKLLMMFG